MSNRVNKTDFVPDGTPFYNHNHGQSGMKSFCPKCHWNSTWIEQHKPKCDGKIVKVPDSIRFPKKKASKRTWKVFTEFLIRKPKLTEEEQINLDRQKTLNQILTGG